MKMQTVALTLWGIMLVALYAMLSDVINTSEGLIDPMVGKTVLVIVALMVAVWLALIVQILWAKWRGE